MSCYSAKFANRERACGSAGPFVVGRYSVLFRSLLTNVVNAWADTAEFYWEIVPSDWEVPSENVTCTIHLPVPDGEQVDGGINVRAWGHGPLNGEVSFDGNDVVYTVPNVNDGDYAEARITFPVEWLSEVEPSTTSMLSAIREEEREWADEANRERESNQHYTIAAFVLSLGSPVIAVVSSLFLKKRHERLSQTKFDKEYYCELPSADHPAVLGYLYEEGTITGHQFSATIAKLVSEHYLVFEEAPKAKKTYQIRRNSWAALDDPIDAAAVEFLFNVVAPLAEKSEKTDSGDGYATLAFSDMRKVSREHMLKYNRGLEAWTKAVSAEARSRRFWC